MCEGERPSNCSTDKTPTILKAKQARKQNKVKQILKGVHSYTFIWGPNM